MDVLGDPVNSKSLYALSDLMQYILIQLHTWIYFYKSFAGSESAMAGCDYVSWVVKEGK